MLAELPAQGPLTGAIRDCDSGRGIAYASVWNPSQQTGSVADSTGTFVLEVAAGDSLRFSALGYTPRTLTASKGQSTREVCLEAAPARLPVATHTATRLGRTRRHGNSSESRQIVTGWSVEPRSGAERGTRIRIGRRAPQWLKAVELHLAQSTYARIRLRVNLYSAVPVDSATRPVHAWLLDTERQSGWVRLDVLEEEVEVTGDIFVSVEVVEAWSPRPENTLLLSAGLFTDGLYFREGVAEPWQRGKVGLGMRVVTVGE